MPARVKAVEDKVCVLTDWFATSERQVPIAHVKVLQGEVPISLRESNLKELKVFSPSTLNSVQNKKSIQQMDEFLGQHACKPNEATKPSRCKRDRSPFM